jgi:hypothetical protein
LLSGKIKTKNNFLSLFGVMSYTQLGIFLTGQLGNGATTMVRGDEQIPYSLNP